MMAPERLEALKSASIAIASFDPNGPGGFTLKHAQLRAGEILELVAEVQRLQGLLSDEATTGSDPSTAQYICRGTHDENC